MKKPDIAKRMARRGRVSQAEAADRLDCVVFQILRRLRHGQDADLPGLGVLQQSTDGGFRLKPETREP